VVDHDAVHDGVTISAGASPSFNEDALLQKLRDDPFHGRFPQFCVALDGPFGTPDPRTVIACLISQKHDDLLAGGATKTALSAFIRDAPAHIATSNAVACV
jgi:hypothetical protein